MHDVTVLYYNLFIYFVVVLENLVLSTGLKLKH